MTFRLDLTGLAGWSLGVSEERFWIAVLLLEREEKRREGEVVIMTFFAFFLFVFGWFCFLVLHFLVSVVVGFSLIVGTLCYCSVL
jgi:hypothetical protein